jgi:hypothetical protein
MELTPDADAQLRHWLYRETHEVVVECVRTPEGVAWGRVLSRKAPGTQCAPLQVATARWSMHTHPRACYRRNGAHYGWPSGADLATALEQRVVEHWVCALEGVYVLKPRRGAVERWKRTTERSRKALEAAWDVASTDARRTPEWGVREINRAASEWVAVSYVPWKEVY